MTICKSKNTVTVIKNIIFFFSFDGGGGGGGQLDILKLNKTKLFKKHNIFICNVKKSFNLRTFLPTAFWVPSETSLNIY